MAEVEQVLEKIKKLLNLSRNNPDLNEASLAAAMAQRLMEQHKIQEALLSETTGAEEVDPTTFDLFEEDKATPTMWKVHLASSIAKLNGCATFYMMGVRKVSNAGIKIVGKQENVSFCMYLFWYLTITIENMAKAALKRKEGKGQIWSNSFKVGAAQEVMRRLEEAKRQARDEAKAEAAETSSTALVKVETALAIIDKDLQSAEAFMRSAFRTRQVSSHLQKKDLAAYAAGRAAGARINLNVRPSGNELKG